MNFKKFAELCEMELDDFLSDMFTKSAGRKMPSL